MIPPPPQVGRSIEVTPQTGYTLVPVDNVVSHGSYGDALSVVAKPGGRRAMAILFDDEFVRMEKR